MSVRAGKPQKRIFLSPPWMSGDERSWVDEAFASNYIAPCGPMVDRFERACSEATGLPHACAVASGTAALDLLYHELGVTRGDAVFCSDLTFVSSIAPAVHRGAEPVFIDCDEATWTLDPELLTEALAAAAKAGRLPKAVVAVDLYGQCCDYDRIEAVCGEYGVPLIVDAAEALGARYDGGRGSALVRECVSALVGAETRMSWWASQAMELDFPLPAECWTR
jgi:dTDP-4-amino-4,6-dideoxygalactose transaminase